MPGSQDLIVIDEGRGWVFDSESEIYSYFATSIGRLEKEFEKMRQASDINPEFFRSYEGCLEQILEEPDEIWQDRQTLDGDLLFIYIGDFEDDQGKFYYLALAHHDKNVPSFVYLHFPTRDEALVDRYRRQALYYNRLVEEIEKGAVDGDALGEGDQLAVVLYKAMLRVRKAEDLPPEAFQEYASYRESAIEEPDEIWRYMDLDGNVLVNFIREFFDAPSSPLYYIAVTVEEANSESHSLLFSFPTSDPDLIERYRRGENLQADEVIQESSH